MKHISEFLQKYDNNINRDIDSIDSLDTEFGTKLSEQEILAYFRPSHEGEINLYFGRIGNGKTAGATADILDLLEKGQVVYANWRINFEGYDERKSIRAIIWKILFFRKGFYVFPKENFHYFNSENVDMAFLSNLTDCHVFIDEGQWIFDSYKGTTFDPESRRLILHTRHFNRSLNIVSQRTQAIHVSARAQINRFYKFVKILSYPIILIKRYEYQDMKQNDVDEEADPISVKTYWLTKRIMRAYNSKYLRGGVPVSQKVYFDVYDMSLKDKFRALLRAFRGDSERFADESSRKL